MSNSQYSHAQWKKPFLLALALTVLGLGAYWLEFKRKPDRTKREDLAKLVFDLEEKTVTRFSISGSKGVKFTFKCVSPEADKLCKAGDNSKWALETPLSAAGDETSVNSLLSAINTLNINDKIDLTPETPESRQLLLKEYGLTAEDRKRASTKRIEVTSHDQKSGEKTQTFVMGETHPMGDTVFALRNENENEVLLIPTYFNSNFEKDLNHWRNKRLFTIDSSTVTALELSGTKGKLKLQKTESDWTINGDLPGDPENIDNLLNAVTFLSADKVLSESKTSADGKRILASARLLLQVSLQSGAESKPVTLALYTRGGRSSASDRGPAQADSDHTGHEHHGHDHHGHSHGAPAKKAPTSAPLIATVSTLDGVFEVEGFARSRIEKTVSELRMTRLLSSVERFAVQTIELSGADFKSPLIIRQKDARWEASDGAPKDFKLNEERIQVLLDALAAPQIEKFFSDSEAPRAGKDRGLKVALSDQGGAKKRVFQFWYDIKKPTFVFAQEIGVKRNDVYALKPTFSQAISWKLEELSSK